MENSFNYHGQWFKPYRHFTKQEREQSVSEIRGKLERFTNEEFEKYWDCNEFADLGNNADLYWWHGKVVIPGWDTFYIVSGWL